MTPKPIREFLGYISHTQLFGYVPLDSLCHILGGVLVTLLGRKLRLRMSTICLILLVLSVLKEVYDSSVLSYTVWESVKDIAVTYIYPAMVITIQLLIKFWSRSDKRQF